jgi:hypothetical protein
MKKVLKTPTEYSKIYDEIYGNFAKKEKYEVTTEYKGEIMDYIFSDMSFQDSTAIKAYCKYHDFNRAAKISGMDKKVLMKNYEVARRHMYSPKNIATAINGYYIINKKNQYELKAEDFGGSKYIITALNKSGIHTKEQLYKHLSNGWWYLWTIPGCGDGARQKILTAIDKWNERSL